ncbi:MAG: hypothetical protein BWK78_05935 [Thiotrichaceae bacterium IS1]|nr:MAG: hypothetical protein BWK78_05935 [Thiotrichaceae bacterium IS1]
MSVTPNVEEVNRPEERQALQQRYRTQIESAEKRGVKKTLLQFQVKVNRRGKAIINIDLQWLYSVVVLDEPYWNYYDQKKHTGRPIDTAREMVDIWLHHQHGPNIRHAALSLDKNGLTLYGKYCMCLLSEKLETCTTLLEENDFVFADKQKWSPFKEQKVPSGYRVIWQERGELAVTKLGEKIQGKTKKRHFANLLLTSTGHRKTDDFIGVHIYSTIDKNWVESVRGPFFAKPDTRQEQYLDAIKDTLEDMGKTWEPI